MPFILFKNHCVRTEDWGLISYQDALARQLEKVEAVAAGDDDLLIFCSHPPVVTLGRGTKPDDMTSWAGETVQISRGGRATYHGPSQIIAYPIFNLNIARSEMPARDLHAYLRALENSIIQALAGFGLDSAARPGSASSDEPSLTGVWVKDSSGANKKIASIGIAVKKWVTYHGIALNLLVDSRAFTGIRPCGFDADIMTSIEAQCGPNAIARSVPDRQAVQGALAQFIGAAISYR